MADTDRGVWVYAPGEVFTDLPAAVADGADCVDAVGQLCGDREYAIGLRASTTTIRRLLDERIDAAHLPAVRRPERIRHRRQWLHIDIDATFGDRSLRQRDRSSPDLDEDVRWRHPLMAFLDRTEISGGDVGRHEDGVRLT